MEEFKHKQEIINTRKGCLGSSDGRLIQQIATAGYVPKTAYERLAIVKGLIEPKNGFTSPAMRYGDIMENEIFNLLSFDDDGKEYKFESNPLWVSKTYGGKHFKLISHPDIVLMDLDKKTLFVYEIKTTKETWKSARDIYKGQLYIHSLLANEIAKENGLKVKLNLVVYDTNGLNLEEGFPPFDKERITIGAVKFKTPPFDIRKAFEIIDDFLGNMNEYYNGEEIDAQLLPVAIKEEFLNVVNLIKELKHKEEQIDKFKERLYEFMLEKDIKSIKNDEFSFIRVDPSETISFDYKRYLDDYAAKYPRKVRKLKQEYKKVSKRKGYTTIKLNNKNK